LAEDPVGKVEGATNVRGMPALLSGVGDM
jgi:hypothetical protein